MVKILAAQYGENVLLKNIFLLVKDFCGGVNVVRNMNEDQMIEAAAMLLDECGNFRLEDYVMMFSMAKRGAFFPDVKIYDRIDIQLISSIMDEYWKRRNEAGRIAQEAEADGVEASLQESVGNRTQLEWNQLAGSYQKERTEGDALLSIAGAMSSLKNKLQENAEQTINEEEAKKQIKGNSNYKNPYPPNNEK